MPDIECGDKFPRARAGAVRRFVAWRLGVVRALDLLRLARFHFGGFGLLEPLPLFDLRSMVRLLLSGGSLRHAGGPDAEGERECQGTKSHDPYYCVFLENHKYIFRKLATVMRMQNQLAARHSLSVHPSRKPGVPAR